MIGQVQIQDRIRELIENNKFPRYSIIVGNRGGGKKLLANMIAKELGCIPIRCGNKAEDARNAVDNSYKVVEPSVYIIPDANTMSTIAQNTMLKVTEEPPNNAYFIMTCEMETQLLPTLLSRATTLRLDTYSVDDISQYIKTKYTNLSDDIFELVVDLCETPGEVDLLIANSPKEFMSYVDQVVENIDVVSGANSFKIGLKLDISGDSEDKFDLCLFWKCFMSRCLHRMEQHPFKYSAGVRITSKYLQELRISGLNRQMCFDNWLLEIRTEWMSYADNN